MDISSLYKKVAFKEFCNSRRHCQQFVNKKGLIQGIACECDGLYHMCILLMGLTMTTHHYKQGLLQKKSHMPVK